MENIERPKSKETPFLASNFLSWLYPDFIPDSSFWVCSLLEMLWRINSQAMPPLSTHSSHLDENSTRLDNAAWNGSHPLLPSTPSATWSSPFLRQERATERTKEREKDKVWGGRRGERETVGPRTEKHAVNSLLLNRRVTYVFSDRGELCSPTPPVNADRF